MESKKETYEWVCYTILAYEIAGESAALAERKIKRKLRVAELGPYDQERVDSLRRLRDVLKREIRLYSKSKYYRGPTGTTANLEDYDFDKLVEDTCRDFPAISEVDMRGIVNFSLYLYYLR
ncbi:MAG TPA: hypothetical protein VF550_09300 [Polyangia bacterium]